MYLCWSSWRVNESISFLPSLIFVWVCYRLVGFPVFIFDYPNRSGFVEQYVTKGKKCLEFGRGFGVLSNGLSRCFVPNLLIVSYLSFCVSMLACVSFHASSWVKLWPRLGWFVTGCIGFVSWLLNWNLLFSFLWKGPLLCESISSC
jgi:hypothetical protein